MADLSFELGTFGNAVQFSATDATAIRYLTVMHGNINKKAIFNIIFQHAQIMIIGSLSCLPEYDLFLKYGSKIECKNRDKASLGNQKWFIGFNAVDYVHISHSDRNHP